ncbi:hypothetical protein SDC9_97012 [bioreactor metagenome]|uniref:Gamma-glutamylcyclotransferase AIG2-like domain-containing protein n=1 Tax=bioreactor metagenome TaxID=1076179 RepID=A0A645ABJ1_9ZZZZ
MNNRYYAAYGAGLNRAEMAKRCPTAKPIGASILRNYRLIFRGSHAAAVANIEPAKGCSVPILIWEITPADEMSLNLYEGFPHLFEKQQLRVRLDGKLVNCMTYVMLGDRPLGKPSAFYYSAVLEGYKAAGFDAEILRNAVQNESDEAPDS